MPCILGGVSNIIDRLLGLDTIGERSYTHSHKEACVLLCQQQQKEPRYIDGSELVRLISERIAENRRLLTERRIPCRGERKNWRFKVQPDFKLGVRYEISLQKAIAILLDADWANAIPTASGVTECEETARSIDLVQRLSDEEWRFVELKALRKGSDGGNGQQTPLFACLELLQYALIFRYSKEHYELLGYTREKNPIITAQKVHLEVLMTQNCYFHNSRLGRFHIKWLDRLVNEGLSAINRQPNLVQFDFRFSEFPKEFEWSEVDHRLLHSLLSAYEYPRRKHELDQHPDWPKLQRKIREAVANRVLAELN
ncbi:MAG: hypothetical protein WCA20_24535 [Candidatus Sulfotelmatobacter sp.]